MSDSIETCNILTLKHNPAADKIIFDLSAFEYIVEENVLIVSRKNKE